MLKSIVSAVFGISLTLVAQPAQGPKTKAVATPENRLEQLVEANIVAVQAYQILLARKDGHGDQDCYPRESPPDAALESLNGHQQKLLATPAEDLQSWVAGRPSAFDPSTDLQPMLDTHLTLAGNLPVNVFYAYLQKQAPKAPRTSLRSVANIYQLDLEMERDGDRLQELIGFYITLGLPIYVGQLGLAGTDQDFLVSGTQLADQSCASPVELSAEDWQIAGRKIWNWGEKRLHIRDGQVVADELLSEPDVARLIPQMKALPRQQIAVIGHSFTMDVHWASPSAFVPIVTSMFKRENPHVEFRQFAAGGLTFSRAYKNFYQDALAWQPDMVLFVLASRTPEDDSDLKLMAEGFRKTGTQVLMFDSVGDSNELASSKWHESLALAEKAGVRIVPARSTLDAAPDKEQFLCMDHIHMKEPYHRLMAKVWLKAILEASKAKTAGSP